jgi:hypothetical protein
MENRAARQVDFDGLVKIYVNDGAVLEDAVTEALESLTETGFHFDSVYVYRNDAEKELKDHIESRIATIEKAAAGTDSFVNANFAMQGILQCLEQKRSESIVEQVAILLHSRSAVRTALNLIPAVKDDDEEDAGKDNGEDDDSDEDEDEENALVTVSVLDFIIKIANVEFEIEAAMRLRLQMFLLEEADLGRIVSRLEEDVCEPRYAACGACMFASTDLHVIQIPILV